MNYDWTPVVVVLAIAIVRRFVAPLYEKYRKKQFWDEGYVPPEEPEK